MVSKIDTQSAMQDARAFNVSENSQGGDNEMDNIERSTSVVNQHSIQVIQDQQKDIKKQISEMCQLIRQNTIQNPGSAQATKTPQYNPKYRDKMLHNIDLSASENEKIKTHPFASLTVRDFDQMYNPLSNLSRIPFKPQPQKRSSTLMSLDEFNVQFNMLKARRRPQLLPTQETIYETADREPKIGLTSIAPSVGQDSVRWEKVDWDADIRESITSKQDGGILNRAKSFFDKDRHFAATRSRVVSFKEEEHNWKDAIRNTLYSTASEHGPSRRQRQRRIQVRSHSQQPSRYKTSILECNDKERLSLMLQNHPLVKKQNSEPNAKFTFNNSKSVLITRNFHRLVNLIKEGRLARVNVGGQDSRILDMDQCMSWISYTVVPKWWILVPEEHSSIRWYWDFLLVILLLIFAVWIPLSIGFKKSEIPPWFEITAASIFMLDIIFLFLTPYCITDGPYEGSYESRPLKIATKYLQTWFVFDCVTSLPLDLVADHSMTEINVSVINTLRVLKLLRTIRLARLFKRLDQFARMNLSLVRCYHLCCICFCIMHGIACAYWGICEYQEFENSDWSPDPYYEDMPLTIQYCKAFSWVLAVMLSRGSFEDAETSTEFALTILFSMVGVVFYAVIVGSATAFFSELDNENGWKRRRLNQMSQFLKQRKVKQSLSRQILKYYQYRWSRNLDTAERIDLFDDLHISLKRSLDLVLIQSMVRKVPMFQEITEPCLEAIMECLNSRIFLPGEWVIITGEVGTEMYIIARGRFEVLPDVLNPPVAVLCEGEFFGEGSLITTKPRNCSIRSQCHGELLVLSATDFISILKDFPIFAISVEKNSTHVKDSKGWDKIRYAVNLCAKYKLVGYENVSFVDMMLSLNDVDFKSPSRAKSVDKKQSKKDRKRFKVSNNVFGSKKKKKKGKEKSIRKKSKFYKLNTVLGFS